MAPATRPDADSFLRAARMHPADLDFGACVAAFLQEMESGLRGEPSTLPMIPNYVETLRTVPSGRRAIAIDAGGTNLRAALVSFDAGGKPLVEGLARGFMPGTQGEVSRDGFFEALASLLAPLAGAADRVGFVFSYPAVIQPSRDARIQRFSKEVKASAVEGQLLGEGLVRAMREAGMPVPSRVVILNDTVAALLAGLRASPGRRFGGYIGFVCGTGVNTSYVESNAALTKVAGLDPAGSQAVNVEAGTFGRAPTGVYDDEFDATTDAPGRYRFEKMVSGGYLGGLCLAVLRGAASAGCLSAEAGRALAGIRSLSTRQANDFLVFPDAGGNPLDSLAPVDAEAAARIMDRLVERSAMLSAVCLSAVLLKSGGGRDPRAPVRITADGTTFWQLKDYRPRVEAAMRRFLRGRNERHYEIASVEDAPLLGAAIAGLTN